MPDLLTHFAVPFALSAPLLGMRRGLLVATIALLPDLDALFYIHRSLTHSLIILAAVSIPPTLLLSLRKTELRWLMAALVLGLFSHVALDALQTYTPLLYPLMRESVLIQIRGGVLFGSSISPYVDTRVETVPTKFEAFVEFDGPLLTNETLLMNVALILAPILMYLRRKTGKSST